tara:strand:- start:4629 stop:5513 length:885 start_codon:yes stop_codon:yes gene_type:complete
MINNQERRNKMKITKGIEIEGISKIDRATLANKMTNETEVLIQSENYNHSTRNHWKMVYDSSINTETDYRNDFELVSPILENLDDLKKITDWFNSNEITKVNKSTGLHIHFGIDKAMDDANLTPDQKLKAIKNLLITYTKFQDDINSILPMSRRKSNWAKRNDYKLRLRNARTSPLKRYSKALNRCQTIREIHTEVHGTRYTAINLTNFMSNGTIEFRQHSSSQDFLKIQKWIELLETMIELAIKKAKANKAISPAMKAENSFDQLFKRRLSNDSYRYFLNRRAELNPENEVTI